MKLSSLKVEKVMRVLLKEPRLIEIKGAKKVIFVGDTHGDLGASKKVISNYLKPGNKIVFLGDYVDRGEQSRENIDFLLRLKSEHPEKIYLLMGNHECHRFLKFQPADFWEELNPDDITFGDLSEEYLLYASIVEKLPLAAVAGDVIALHGALPDVKTIKKIKQIKLATDEWLQITWGDFFERDGKLLSKELWADRPKFGRDWFFEIMERFNKKVLIRSHQPNCPQFMFDDRCLTIFTSSAYARERTIAIADLTKEIKTAKDLEVKKI